MAYPIRGQRWAIFTSDRRIASMYPSGLPCQQVTLTAQADQIGQDRFKLSDLSVTDLGIATQEKDRARRDAILALRDYWQAFYTLRLLTLYDFETEQKIIDSR